tara:strand:+ start:408 stop:566 length:159 start_codon:yes stop_codon:yes gene_type:complete
MKVGDLVRVTWQDGLVLEGTFSEEARGYVILLDKQDKKIVCNPACVKFEVIK